MIDDLLETNFFREYGNGMWFLANLAFIVFILQFLQYLRSRHLLQYSRGDVQISIALLVYLTGSTARAFFIWLLLLSQNAELERLVEVLESLEWMMPIMATIGTIGVLCVMRVLSDVGWSFRVWVTTGIIVAVVPLIIHVAANESSRQFVSAWWPLSPR